ncbi:hypothetical protein [Sphingobacterium tabacisoli]|uniref:Uncharacterized protein n=1 Tax=Sphingobacterium tabacisoli TaxID=2044855 RepID=A0ABW5L2R0_9SPHI|nr:hypothetical protein [Sphingobacterium tabacisoli]
MNRICIYPKDISMITGKSYRQSLRIYNAIKRKHNKEPHQLVTLDEVCQYLGLNPDKVKETV